MHRRIPTNDTDARRCCRVRPSVSVSRSFDKIVHVKIYEAGIETGSRITAPPFAKYRHRAARANAMPHACAPPLTSVATLIESQHASSTMKIHLACELL